jgi:hypothetical protein
MRKSILYRESLQAEELFCCCADCAELFKWFRLLTLLRFEEWCLGELGVDFGRSET